MLSDRSVMRVLNIIRRKKMTADEGLRLIVADQGYSYSEKHAAQTILNDPEAFDLFLEKDGGKGSGNFGHKGRPGQRGGSGSGGLTKVSGGEIHAKGYSLTSSEVGRSKGSDRSFVSKGTPTKAMPNGTGSTVLSEGDLKEGVHSCVKYLTPDGSLTPEREKLHADAVNELFEGKQPVPEGEQKTFYVLGGGPASGKSHLTNPETCAQFGMPSSKDCATIDADEMKKKLPEYGIKNREAAANFAHEESSAMAKRAMQAAFDNGYNCTLDGTGDGSEASLRKKIKSARDKGYKVEGAYVTVPTDIAVERAVARGKKIGRVVPAERIRKTHADVSRIFPKVASEFDHVTLYDTRAGKPVLIAECFRGQQITVHNQQLYDDFLAKGK